MSVIPHTAITIEGDTAWWVKPAALQDGLTDPKSAWMFNRPCDTCDGSGSFPAIQSQTDPCPDCAGTGRHTFTLDVQLPWAAKAVNNIFTDEVEQATRQITVHILEVLPIVYDWNDWMTKPLVSIEQDGSAVLVENRIDGFCEKVTDITLPTDAASGMWAVKMALHS
jgi:hypothetical protein